MASKHVHKYFIKLNLGMHMNPDIYQKLIREKYDWTGDYEDNTLNGPVIVFSIARRPTCI